MKLTEEIACQEGTIASKVLMKSPGGNVTLFAFSTGQELSEHTAPFDALVQCLEGETRVTIAGEALEHTVRGSLVIETDAPKEPRVAVPFEVPGKEDE